MDWPPSEALWLAVALVLIFEGLLPLVAPSTWRRVFSEMLKLQDGQLRFFGLVTLGSGLLLWWLLA
ncbi:MAG: DUF2065 domain-containing protein [Hydrogenophaga sp.]|jgi:hypothetical protein|uniref:DUF2065 domain-containing protein n=1 Tax=Hydrogenophaga sp. TaxID=1904254 RepID=UPI0027191D84|nr:DUF2065 domain-containing protein [Hydrogenophaga sp.]MDO9200641.1 DUF2065 domain-containing protein [Hydrogenophaga sp.]MDO9479613.1 DUF2065 domain-containing protein [Hydrogenophaga sp.]MDO9569909.1 DUF2065 domain-containing protein [Hydrogenophaga sp.]MDP1894325.1 DUF2065 domain-containing protein [Hydrogenophaga sp.]MDP2096700.1 DUF2065 domain-containing protein [Hydrogenophaga sp.]